MAAPSYWQKLARWKGIDVRFGPKRTFAEVLRLIAPSVRALRGCRLLRCVRTKEFSTTRAGAADLDHRGLTYFHIVSDVCGLGIEASRRQFLEVSGFMLFAIPSVPGTGKYGDFA